MTIPLQLVQEIDACEPDLCQIGRRSPGTFCARDTAAIAYIAPTRTPDAGYDIRLCADHLEALLRHQQNCPAHSVLCTVTVERI